MSTSSRVRAGCPPRTAAATAWRLPGPLDVLRSFAAAGRGLRQPLHAPEPYPTTRRGPVTNDVPAPIVTADTFPARLRQTSASGFRPPHEPVVPEELFDAIGELAGRIDR